MFQSYTSEFIGFSEITSNPFSEYFGFWEGCIGIFKKENHKCYQRPEWTQSTQQQRQNGGIKELFLNCITEKSEQLATQLFCH